MWTHLPSLLRYSKPGYSLAQKRASLACFSSVASASRRLQWRPKLNATPNIHRALHTTSILRDSSFTNLLADDNPPAVQVSSISDAGIQLVDGLLLPGPCIFLEGTVFLWDVPPTNATSKVKEERWAEWSKSMFELFEVVTPKPEILLLGTGKTIVQPPPFLREYLSTLGIQLDVLDTRNACSTYNLLSEEGRRVSAALLPFTPYTWPKSQTS